MKVVATLSFSFLSWAALGQAADLPKFRHVTIDANVKIGYGTAIADMNGDKKPDIILCDARNIAWYENPSWKKHIIVENLTTRDHVCIAVRDIDGDGKAEIAAGAQWNPGETSDISKSGAVFVNSGAVSSKPGAGIGEIRRRISQIRQRNLGSNVVFGISATEW